MTGVQACSILPECSFETLYEDLLHRKAKLSLLGLGYVGLPIAVAFANQVDVVGFDANRAKIRRYLAGEDPTNEVGSQAVLDTTMLFTNDPAELEEAKFHIIAVPTPIHPDKTPDLAPIISASEILGRHLTKHSIVVYESTVYPGVTEDICVPILERESGLVHGVDFKVGYSPERVNPGDKVYRLENIVKIVSGSDQQSLDIIAKVYELVVKVGVHKASCIKVAEAAKVAENSQRDVNIAFINELAVVFDRMGIDTNEVVDAMNTKWNALRFRPGLVGGHCIGVDPYYFLYESEKLGSHSQLIYAARQINNRMGPFVADATTQQMILAGINVRFARVAIYGVTFKEDCNDIRNSKVVDVVKRLTEFGVRPMVTDPLADPKEVWEEYQIALTDAKDIEDVDCIIFAVAHSEYREMSMQEIRALYGSKEPRVLIDVKGMFPRSQLTEEGFQYWRL